MKLVFLLEEYSMRVLLEGLLPRLYPDLAFLCVHHEGKQDLEKSVPRKLKAWREPGVQFVIVRDNDVGDCRVLKQKLVSLCEAAHRPDSVVRIACQELEAWYLGDTAALADAFEDPTLLDLDAKERFRDPDAVVRPSAALAALVPEFQKVSGARRMAARLGAHNKSRSYRALLGTIERALATAPAARTSEGN